MRGDHPGRPARLESDVEVIPEFTPTRSLIDREIAVRIPLPERARAHSDEERHPFGGACLVLAYRPFDEPALIEALEQAIEAIRRGPRS